MHFVQFPSENSFGKRLSGPEMLLLITFLLLPRILEELKFKQEFAQHLVKQVESTLSLTSYDVPVAGKGLKESAKALSKHALSKRRKGSNQTLKTRDFVIKCPVACITNYCE